MIYFMQSVEGGPVKIGVTTDVERRRLQLEKHYATGLTVLRVFPGGREDERSLHERFAASRIGRTEQFRPTQDIMEFIGRPLLVGQNPEAVEAMDGPGWTSIRLPDDLVAQARAIAGFRGETIVEVMVAILTRPLLDQYEETVRRAFEGKPQPKRRKGRGGQDPDVEGPGGPVEGSS